MIFLCEFLMPNDWDNGLKQTQSTSETNYIFHGWFFHSCVLRSLSSFPTVIKERLWWNWSLQSSSAHGSSGMSTERPTVYLIQQARRSGHTPTWVTITCVSSIIQLSTRSYSFVTVCCFAFSLGPPLISQHPSLFHSVSPLVLSISTSSGSNGSQKTIKE